MVDDACRLSVRADPAGLGGSIHADDRRAERRCDVNRSRVGSDMERRAIEKSHGFRECRASREIDRRPRCCPRDLGVRRTIRVNPHEDDGAHSAECVDDCHPRSRGPALPPLHRRRVDHDRLHLCADAVRRKQRGDGASSLVTHRQRKDRVLGTRTEARGDVQSIPPRRAPAASAAAGRTTPGARLHAGRRARCETPISTAR